MTGLSDILSSLVSDNASTSSVRSISTNSTNLLINKKRRITINSVEKIAAYLLPDLEVEEPLFDAQADDELGITHVGLTFIISHSDGQSSPASSDSQSDDYKK